MQPSRKKTLEALLQRDRGQRLVKNKTGHPKEFLDFLMLFCYIFKAFVQDAKTWLKRFPSTRNEEGALTKIEVY